MTVLWTNRTVVGPSFLFFCALSFQGVRNQRSSYLTQGEGQLIQKVDGPTEQPATRGQDEQVCGNIGLPDSIHVLGETATIFTRPGIWQWTIGSAVLASWSLDFLSFTEKVSFSTGSRLFAETSVTTDERDLGVRFHLPARPNFTITTTTLRDCDGVLVYFFLELDDRHSQRYQYEIYNRIGELVAKSDPGGHLDCIHFYDDVGVPIVLAQQQSQELEGVHTKLQRREPFGHGGVLPWLIQYAVGFGSNSTLLLPQNRWVIAVVVTLRALRDASRVPGDAATPSPIHYFLKIMPCALLLLFFLAICLGAMWWIYQVVFPLPVDALALQNSKPLKEHYIRT